MESKKVPQQNISTYAGNRKAMYATNDNGEYTVVASSGWAVEEAVTRQALQELERLADEALESVRNGSRSPLFFHMYDRRMDLPTLAQSTGIFKWRIKRHFKPNIFKKLSQKTLGRYCDALGINIDTLCSPPPQRRLHND